MRSKIEAYIRDQEFAWSPVTLKKEGHRLRAWGAYLTGEPRILWTALEKRRIRRYTILTIWTRVSHFYDWMVEKGHVESNPYKTFKKRNARLFKHSYQRSRVSFSFIEALVRIKTIPNLNIRDKALQLLYSGMRWSESFTLKNSQVIGKGGKPRRVYIPEGVRPPLNLRYSTFYKELKRVGLKPHDLRKLAATRLMERGASMSDLCEVMGWSSMTTASVYLQPKKDEELKKLILGGHDE